MTIQNILALTVLLSLGSYNLIQAEIIRDVDVPRINVTKMAGKWYQVSTYTEDTELECATSIIVPKSKDSYIWNMTFTSKVKENYSEFLNEPMINSFLAEMVEDSSIIQSEYLDEDLIFWVIFDSDYDSYMAIYSADRIDEVYTGRNGYVFIISRQPTISDEIIEKVKQSNFYQQGVDPSYHLIGLDASGCD